MKLLFTFLLTHCIAITQAQLNNFDQKVQFIQKKVECCAIPLSKSSLRRVTNINISADGSTILTYSDKSPASYFNLFKLYNEELSKTGIDTILRGRVIQFFVTEEKAKLIKFRTVTDAKEVYMALLALLNEKKEKSTISVLNNFNQFTTDINNRISTWAEGGSKIKISAENDGRVVISNRGNTFFRFNLLELYSDEESALDGILIEQCEIKKHAPYAAIKFKKGNYTVGFIRIKCNTPLQELEAIRFTFLELKRLCIINPEKIVRHKNALYFVPRNAIINSKNEFLTQSIRAIDGKEDLASTIKSNGEGWLDKDFLPVGKWQFFATTSLGKEYLYKSGSYQKTNPAMFYVMGIDSLDLAKNYKLTNSELKMRQVETVPFIKVNVWNYFKPDSTLLKKMIFKSDNIPISTSILMMDENNLDNTSLIVNLKENMDEWEREKNEK